MIGAHALGIISSHNSINKTPAKCLVCGEYSECQIINYEYSIHVFYVKIKVLDEQFWFDWEKCNHRAVLFDKQDVSRYKQEQVDTGILLVSYFQTMKLQMMAMPKRMSKARFVFLVIAALIFGVLLGVLLVNLFDKLGIPLVLYKVLCV